MLPWTKAVTDPVAAAINMPACDAACSIYLRNRGWIVDSKSRTPPKGHISTAVEIVVANFMANYFIVPVAEITGGDVAK